MACPPPHTHTAFKNILALAIAQLTFLIAKLTFIWLEAYLALEHLRAGSLALLLPSVQKPCH